MIISRFMLAVLFPSLFMTISVCLGDDTIFANESLSADQTIVSAGGVFELGFFKPGKPSNYYIGIWYKQVTPRIVVWVANREKPVLDRFSSELKISNGSLVLFNESKIQIWSTNRSFTSSPAVKAVLLDSGNLVLKDGSNSSKPLWQSFDHPTNTWLAGSKFGYNKRTKTKNILTSWKNSEDPAPGLFSLKLDPNDNSYVILWNRSRRYWTTGSWNGRIFALVPEMNRRKNYNFNFVTNENESYFTYFDDNSSSTTVSRVVMDVSGQMNQPYLGPTGWTVIWSFPRQQCQVYALCGTFGSCNENSLPFCNCLKGFEPKSQTDWDLKDYSGGCIRKTKLQCGSENPANGKRDRFLEMSRMSLPENMEYVPVDSMVDCESTCLKNCSCTAYAYDKECSIWTGDLINLQQLGEGDTSGRTLYVRLAESELPRPKRKKRITIGVVTGSSAGLVVLIGLIVFLISRRRRQIAGTRKALGDSLVVFGYKDLQQVTKNFSEKLGGGSFGSVFKGTLPDSTIVAVKKLEGVVQGEKQFRTEVSTIGNIQHVNLVRLRGFCSQGTQRLLVYDFMSEGSLAARLFHPNNSYVLDWKTRYQIALGIARGLLYLHEKCRDCIIHCDIKPENVLLDVEFCPKVADFGLAKLVGREFSRVLTTMRGTIGYLAPEWITGVAITSKADVYSYGMMLFELASGKRNSEQIESDGKLIYFPSMASTIVIQGGDVLSIVDGRLDGNADREEIERLCKVGCWCIQDDEAHRPSMGQVVQMLEGIIEVNLPPVPRYLHFFDDDEENVMFFAE
ncbi:hypothetical protein TIFTF001_030315 [Ficus carica]|uniref:Receptor-like serine/threonine-protein kinase n=1 Tax=Ficus carica TaxID=3494 RepID=A0AA88DTX0_FICCA|nr:hypothetical protein TIFTF001_030315 [Ficus carica]